MLLIPSITCECIYSALQKFLLTVFVITGLTASICFSVALAADEVASFTSDNNEYQLSTTPMLTGPKGLNLTPSARFGKTGEIRLTTSTSDPYAHLSVGAQLFDGVFMGLRQTSEVSSLTELSDRLFPGLDFKFKLLDETRYKPALALGLQSAYGHKRQAGEYLVASKRYGSFDFSAGIAWGRLGSAGHMDNPLSVFGGHFEKKRPLDGETLNSPGDWFTGEQIGFFGGISYHPKGTPFTLKADWGADRYIREAAAIDGFDTPDPWSISLDYTPFESVSANIGLVGGKKIMGRLTFRGQSQNWGGKWQDNTKPAPVYPVAIGAPEPGLIQDKSKERRQYLTNPVFRNHRAHTTLVLNNTLSAPKAYGRLMRDMSLYGGDKTRAVHITPHSHGLEGRPVTIYQKDMRKAVLTHSSSPQEIWRNSQIGIRKDSFTGPLPLLLTTSAFKLEQEISLAEDDTSLISRSSLTQESRAHLGGQVFIGLKTRLNLGNNLDDLERFNQFRPNDGPVVRSDIARFADQTIGIDRLYAAYMATPYTDLHLGLAVGYLEEIYAGGAAEILYRPFGRTWSIGGSLGQVWRRDPDTTLNNDLQDSSVTTGHLHLFYEVPGTTSTISAKLGRYLGEDWGMTLELGNRFDNGVDLSGFVTASTEKDKDIFGGESIIYSGLKLSVPLGNFRYVPENTKLVTSFAPIGRDKGQVLNAPLNLYEKSEIFSYRHYMRNWGDILK
mgnify:CR=1 FL=1